MTQPTSALPTAPPPPAPASPAPRAATRRKKEPQQSNVKETLEQILVAFILAFIFRCFIVEAYVIPTGSMAPTLLGAHMNFRCPDCGWHWTVNYSGDNNGETVPNVAAEVYPIRCANCGYKLPRELPAEPENDASYPPVAYGDRILVQKYIYLLHEPRRWDVVVFKTPDTPRNRAGEPEVEPFTQNYIKRLVGTPGETIMVLDGDVYVAPTPKALADYKPEDFKIQHKPYKVQEAMWRIVYDNDHLPRGLPRTYMLPGNQYTSSNPEITDYPFRQPWKSTGSGWDTTGRRFSFTGTESAQLSFDAEEMPEKHSLTDWVGYDVSHIITYAAPRGADVFRDRGYDLNDGDLQDLSARGYDSHYSQYNGRTVQYFKSKAGARKDPLFDVSDVKLMFTYARTSGEGPLRANITKHRNLFSLEVTPTKAKLNLFAPGASAPKEIGSVPLKAGSTPIRIEMAVVDYRASVRIDGEEVIATTPETFAPDVAQLLQDFKEGRRQPKATVSLEAAAQTCEVSHLSLWRDVYYLNEDSRTPLRWAMPTNFGTSSAQLMQLGPDEFFVMGDNSMLSSDARVWTSPVNLPYEDVNVQGGRVPRRFMLGRAFFVYWPAGYSPVNGFIRFVPNFGEMRFIH
jgi:signal peptidase I